MNITIESVKDEVAQSKGYKDWKHVLEQYKKDELLDINWFEKMAIELYHSRKCEEAGKELPTLYDMEQWVSDMEYDVDAILMFQKSILYYSTKASALLATKQEEMGELKKEYARFSNCVLEQEQEIQSLKSQLQESKAEIERLNKEINVLTETLNNPLDRR